MKLKLLPGIKLMSKLIFYGLSLQLIFFEMLIASGSHAQSTKDIREVYLNINVENAEVEEIFKKIEKETDFRFTYDIKDVKRAKKIDIAASGLSLYEMLEELSRLTKFRFRQTDFEIDVKKIKTRAEKQVPVEVVMQSISISGTVTDEFGSALPGVNVLIAGTTQGTVTNIDGNYQLSVPEDAEALIFSFIGYESKQVGYDRDKRYYFQTNGSVDVTIPWIEGLKFTGTAAVDKYIKHTKKWETPWFLYSASNELNDDGTPVLTKSSKGPAEPRLTQSDEDQLNILLGGILNYERSFGDHALTLLAGVNRETTENSGFNAYRRYFISSTVDQMFAGGDAEKNNGGSAWERARLSYFGRVAYNYKEKYMAEFLWRYDGSYMFAEDSRFGFFPGVLAAWQISEENFWNIPVINYLKLRASYGQMGNDQIYYDDVLQEYQYLSTMGFDRTYVIGGALSKTLYETRVPNTAVTWEVANNANVGLEGQLLNGKIFFELDAFLNKRTSILWRRNASVPQTTGMSLPAENIGEVENKGWEFRVGYNGQVGDFSYSVSANGGYAKNEIIFWDEAPGAPEWQKSTGKPMGTYVIYEYDGVFKDMQDIEDEQLDYSDITNALRPGDMKYKDVNDDGKITPDDQVRTDKSNLPTFQGGVSIGMQYRNFDLSILFQGSAGAQVYLSTNESGRIGNYLLDVYENSWTVDNPSSEHPRITDRSDQYYSGGNSYWLRSTDYIRLKNLEIGYTLPAAIGEKVGISNLRIYVNGLNLFTIDKYDVFDPESTESRGQYYPQARIINTGLTLTF